MTERTTRRWPGLKHFRRPRSRRAWLITAATTGALLIFKLVLLALLIRLLTH